MSGEHFISASQSPYSSNGSPVSNRSPRGGQSPPNGSRSSGRNASHHRGQSSSSIRSGNNSPIDGRGGGDLQLTQRNPPHVDGAQPNPPGAPGEHFISASQSPLSANGSPVSNRSPRGGQSPSNGSRSSALNASHHRGQSSSSIRSGNNSPINGRGGGGLQLTERNPQHVDGAQPNPPGAQPNPDPVALEPPPRFFITVKQREAYQIIVIFLLAAMTILSMHYPEEKQPVGGFRLALCIGSMGAVTAIYLVKVFTEYRLDNACLFWHNCGGFYEKSVPQVLGLVFIGLTGTASYKALRTSNNLTTYWFTVGAAIFSCLYAATQIVHADKDPSVRGSVEVDGENREVYRRMKTSTAYPHRGHLQILEHDDQYPKPYFLN